MSALKVKVRRENRDGDVDVERWKGEERPPPREEWEGGRLAGAERKEAEKVIPGCIDIAPPYIGHVVLFRDVPMPPQGYIHCMPYGNVSFVTRLLPRQPGYVMMVCADDIERAERKAVRRGSGEKRILGANATDESRSWVVRRVLWCSRRESQWYNCRW